MTSRPRKQELVDLFDSSLKFAGLLGKQEMHKHVYQVKTPAGNDLVLKWGSRMLRDGEFSGFLFSGDQVMVESRAMRKLADCKSTPILYDFFECFEEGYVALLKEFIPGTTFPVFLKKASTSAKKSVGKTLCSRLEEVANRGVAPFDRNDNNIIITPELEPYIIDFGIARFREDFTDKDSFDNLSTQYIEYVKRRIEQAMSVPKSVFSYFSRFIP